MPLVLDASVALTWHFEDETSEYAEHVLDRLETDEAIVPALWPLEMANGLIIAERRGRLSPAKLARAIDLSFDLSVSVDETSTTLALGPVLELARSQGLSAYDAAYLELAMRQGIPLATQDEDLRDAADRVGVTLAE